MWRRQLPRVLGWRDACDHCQRNLGRQHKLWHFEFDSTVTDANLCVFSRSVSQCSQQRKLPCIGHSYGATVNLTSRTGGSNTNYSLSVQVTSSVVCAGFPPASFTMTTSGPTLTGGAP
jgi:hypothetical protein